jgi:ATP-dependent Clp protease ATP-binding subunit ClpX
VAALPSPAQIAAAQLGSEAPVERLLEQATHGLVFVDEVDKIRSQVGGEPNIAGIRAQEALLTLIENEAVAFTLPDWAGGGTVNLDSSGLLFVCAGAFEGLYDAVYYRVTAGKDQGALKPVTVVDENGRAREEVQFSLRHWLKTEDLFEYGMSPQFLSRFDAVVLLEALSEEALAKIFAEGRESGLCQSQAYFASFGCKLEMTAEAAQHVVREAARKPRLGARALKEVFRRIVSPLEFDPVAAGGPSRVIRIDLARVKQALGTDTRGEGSASSAAGWDESFRG